jgi:hypothetical protein
VGGAAHLVRDVCPPQALARSEQRHRQRVHLRIAPPVVVNASTLVDVLEEALNRRAPPKTELADFEVVPEVEPAETERAAGCGLSGAAEASGRGLRVIQGQRNGWGSVG